MPRKQGPAPVSGLKQTKKQIAKRKSLSVAKHHRPPKVLENIWEELQKGDQTAIVEAYLAIKSRPNLIVLDIDGTILNEDAWRSPHSLGTARPHFSRFLKSIRPFFDVILFTAADELHARNTCLGHLKGYCDLYLWNVHRTNGQKDVSFLAKHCEKLLLLDDRPYLVHKNSVKFFLPVPTWSGDKNDSFFRDLGTELREAHKEAKKIAPRRKRTIRKEKDK